MSSIFGEIEMTDIHASVSPAAFVPQPKVSHEEHVKKCRRFDGAMHGKIGAAKSKEDWLALLGEMLTAAAISWKEVGGLRNGLRDRFVKECPHGDVVYRFQRETNTLPEVAMHAPSPLGNKTQDRHAVEARRRNSRQERLKAQFGGELKSKSSNGKKDKKEKKK